jgi:hypothetical protein
MLIASHRPSHLARPPAVSLSTSRRVAARSFFLRPDRNCFGPFGPPLLHEPRDHGLEFVGAQPAALFPRSPSRRLDVEARFPEILSNAQLARTLPRRGVLECRRDGTQAVATLEYESRPGPDMQPAAEYASTSALSSSRTSSMSSGVTARIGFSRSSFAKRPRASVFRRPLRVGSLLLAVEKEPLVPGIARLPGRAGGLGFGLRLLHPWFRARSSLDVALWRAFGAALSLAQVGPCERV